MIRTLQEAVTRLSGKKCEFGFYNDFSILHDSMFLLEPSGRRSMTIGVSGRKEYTSTMNLYYFYFNHISTNSLEVIEEINSLLERVMADEEVKKKIIAINYEYSASNVKESEDDLTGILEITIRLEIKER
nr:MAG TPA: hypothetical protein [Bacteriophage sp.]